jgi:hypothetical protein
MFAQVNVLLRTVSVARKHQACRRPDRGGRGRAGAEMLVLGRAYPAGQLAGQVSPPMGSVTRACLHGVACPVVVMAACEGARVSVRDGVLSMPGRAIR